MVSDGRWDRWSGSESRNFFITQREFWQDERLTPNAKALMGYLLSLPPGWRMSIKNIQAQFKGTPAYMGRHYLQVAVKNLMEHKYLHRKQMLDEKGEYTYWKYVYDDVPFDPGWS